ncbi:hypothetical protein GGI35DRAFT_87142 [Trichoderma velutinum]
MNWDDNGPFRRGAANPILGDETYGVEEDLGSLEPVATTITDQLTIHNAYGAQEWGDGPTLDPSLLQNSDLTPPGVALGIPTGPSIGTYVDSVPSEIQCSHEET